MAIYLPNEPTNYDYIRLRNTSMGKDYNIGYYHPAA